jgi:hypothetical protein
MESLKCHLCKACRLSKQRPALKLWYEKWKLNRLLCDHILEWESSIGLGFRFKDITNGYMIWGTCSSLLFVPKKKPYIQNHNIVKVKKIICNNNSVQFSISLFSNCGVVTFHGLSHIGQDFMCTLYTSPPHDLS